MPKRFIPLFFLLFATSALEAQPGGNSTFAFMGLTNSARVAAMGGTVVAIWDDDPDLTFHNPALLNWSMSSHLALDYVDYFTDIQYGYASFAQGFKKVGMLAAGIHYIDYGNFKAADRFGNITGNFTAREYTADLIWSRTIDSVLHIGVNIKPAWSELERYRSTAISADLGVAYVSRDSLFTAGFVMKNIGTQLRPYYPDHRERLPFEMQIGVSQKLEHAPFRFSLTAHNLQQFDVSYIDEVTSLDPFTGEPVQQNRIEDFADKMMRHVIIGVEFMPFNALHFRFGYNYLRRKELKIDSRLAMVGFSWGFGLNIRAVKLSFGRASYHLAGATNHFSLSTDFSALFNRIL